MVNEIGNSSKDSGGNIYLADLELSVRARNCLEKSGFTTLQQVASLTHDELYSIQHLGAKTANEIETVIKQHRSDEIETRPWRFLFPLERILK